MTETLGPCRNCGRARTACWVMNAACCDRCDHLGTVVARPPRHSYTSEATTHDHDR